MVIDPPDTDLSDDEDLRQIAESTWLRMTTIHPRSYDQLSDEAFDELQAEFIENDHEALMSDIGAVRVGKGGVVYIGFDTEWEEKAPGLVVDPESAIRPVVESADAVNVWAVGGECLAAHAGHRRTSAFPLRRWRLSRPGP